MYSTEQWPIAGYRERPVPNTFYGKGSQYTRLAVTFPGFAYTSQAPLFHYLIELFYDRGCDVLSASSKSTGTESGVKDLYSRRAGLRRGIHQRKR